MSDEEDEEEDRSVNEEFTDRANLSEKEEMSVKDDISEHLEISPRADEVPEEGIEMSASAPEISEKLESYIPQEVSDKFEISAPDSLPIEEIDLTPRVNQRKLKKEQEQKRKDDVEKAENILQMALQKAAHDKEDGVILDDSGSGMNTPSRGGRKALKQQRENYLKGIIQINLWINGTSYEYGALCTFCAVEVAIVNCPECDDFFCQDCDLRNHEVKKRKHHIRSHLSKLTKDDAAKLCTFAVRYHAHLKKLQLKCRQKFRRYLDSSVVPLEKNKRNPSCYYYNSVYGTTSWIKPYCLRNMELRPLTTETVAASQVQGLYRMYAARTKTINNMKGVYNKIFDRTSGAYYYAYSGSSLLLPKQAWRRPLLCGRRGFISIPDISVLYTVDISAIKIQNKWRSVLVGRFLKSLTRATYTKSWDPSRGNYGYYVKETNEHFTDKKPLILGTESWDQNYVPDWSRYKVSVFLRRLGLKEYSETFYSYGVDGNVLLKLNDEDFENLNITNKIHRKKILIELERICPLDSRGDVEDIDDLHIRRERMKTLKRRSYAVSVIQRIYRRYAGKAFIARLKLEVDLNYKKQLLAHSIKESNGWWTEKEIPSKNITNLTLVELDEKEKNRREKEDVLVLKNKRERANSIRLKKSFLEKKGYLIEAEKYGKNKGENNGNGTSGNNGNSGSNANYLSNEKHEAGQSVRRGSVNSFFSKNGTKTTAAFSSENNMDNDDNEKETNVLGSALLRKHNISMSYIGNNNVNEKNDELLKLPDIKNFGRKLDRVTINGWGKYSDIGSWIPLIKKPENSSKNEFKKDENMNNSDKNGKNGDKGGGNGSKVSSKFEEPAPKYDTGTNNNVNMNAINDNIATTNYRKTDSEPTVTKISPDNPNNNMFHDTNKKHNTEQNKIKKNVNINNTNINTTNNNNSNKCTAPNDNLNTSEKHSKEPDQKVFNVIDDVTHNPTRLLTEKLKNSGYDQRRKENFLKNRMN